MLIFALPCRAVMLANSVVLVALLLFFPLSLRAQESPIPTIEVEFPKGDQELHAWIAAKLAEVPPSHLLMSVPRADLAYYHRLVDEALVAGHYHLENFPQSKHRADVAAMQAGFLILNQARFVKTHEDIYKEITGERIPFAEYEAIRDEYTAEVQRVLDLGLARVEEQLRPLLKQLGSLHGLRGEAHMMSLEYLNGARSFRKAIQADPEHPNRDRLAATECDALYKGQFFDATETTCLKYLQDRPRSRYWADVFFILHKTYRHTGQIDKGLALWDRHVPTITRVAEGQPIQIEGKDWIAPEDVRRTYNRYLAREKFYRFFFAFARGECDTATKLLESFMEFYRGLEAAGATIDGSTKVYHDMQAVPYYRTLIGQCERPAPALELASDDWVQAPADSSLKGKVTLVFFSPDHRINLRYRPLAVILGNLAREYAERGLQVCWIANSDKTRPGRYEKTFQSVLDLAGELDLGFPCGLDVGPDYALHHAYFLDSLGTGNAFLIDRDGNIVWRVIDPLDRDERLFRAIIERLLAAPTSPEDQKQEK